MRRLSYLISGNVQFRYKNTFLNELWVLLQGLWLNHITVRYELPKADLFVGEARKLLEIKHSTELRITVYV